MAMAVSSEDEIDRWLERGGRFFKAVARNPVVRGELIAVRYVTNARAHGRCIQYGPLSK